MHLGRAGRSGDRSRLVATLDVGSSKMCCLIAERAPVRTSGQRHVGAGPSPPFKVHGFANRRSRGIENGSVVDLAAAQQVVREVVAEAEEMARSHISAVHVAVNCGRPLSTTFAGHVELSAGIVREQDIEALDGGAEAFAQRLQSRPPSPQSGAASQNPARRNDTSPDSRTILMLDRIGYRLDGIPASPNPQGLAGHRLDADHHAVSVEAGRMRNLSGMIESCHLAIAGLIPAGYASALASTTVEERRLGVTSIDIGAGVTSIAAFADGHLLYTDAIPVGGQHVTLDIAHTLGISLAEAERIKALYGTLVASASAEHEVVPLRDAGEGSRDRTTKAVISSIVRQRMHRLLQVVGEHLAGATVGRIAARRVVLSGGSSRLLGLCEFLAAGGCWPTAGAAIAPTARIGQPALLAALAEARADPSFACVAGLQIAARDVPQSRLGGSLSTSGRQGYFGRMERWLQESF